MNRAPNSAPPIVARPPTTIAARNANDSASGNDSGARNPIGSVNSAPPRPAAGADRERTGLVAGEIDAHGAGRDLVVADRHQRAPDPPADEEGGEDEHHRGHHER